MRGDVAMLGPPGFERKEMDAYFTIDEMCLEQLLDAVTIPPGMILEPAAGRGHLVRQLRDAGRNVMASDLFMHADPLVDDIRCGVDAAGIKTLSDYGALVTNFPYNVQNNILRNILPIAARDNCMVAILTRAAWPIAKSRADMVHHNPNFVGVVHLPRRPWWSDVRVTSPRHDFIWCIWGAQPRDTENPSIFYPRV